MGYTHYWYRPLEINQEIFTAIGQDFQSLILPLRNLGVRLGDIGGALTPTVSGKEIAFNGFSNCGHPKNAEITIPWPADRAGGIAVSDEADKVIAGQWFAGALLNKRICDGNCSYESFYFPLIETSRQPITEKKLIFNFCKTAYRPYDIAVTAFLVIAKHHLKETIDVSSDGNMDQWFDGMMLCKINLGYGLNFKLRTER